MGHANRARMLTSLDFAPEQTGSKERNVLYKTSTYFHTAAISPRPKPPPWKEQERAESEEGRRQAKKHDPKSTYWSTTRRNSNGSQFNLLQGTKLMQ